MTLCSTPSWTTWGAVGDVVSILVQRGFHTYRRPGKKFLARLCHSRNCLKHAKDALKYGPGFQPIHHNSVALLSRHSNRSTKLVWQKERAGLARSYYQPMMHFIFLYT